MKPKVRFMVPVWGESYIRRFIDLSLPSFMAPGNLPALAEMTDLEICILTLSRDHAFFEGSPAFMRLRALARFRFIDIDDLVLDSWHGVTLTLAYLRGITGVGAAMTEQAFVFINSDIVLADGAFRSVARRIIDGHRIVLVNSIRSISEEVEPLLMARIDRAAGVLAVEPRELVTMAMKSMHPMQVAKIVNSDLCHSAQINQFYWQADETTLVSRHFLMFAVCLQPERAVEEIHGFCDYAFVPAFCPTAKAVAIEDSDEFFALELQYRNHEEDFLRIGRGRPEDAAASLSAWTTAVHRHDALNHTITFHGDDLPANTAGLCAEADRYIRNVVALMTPEPKPFDDHPYWVGSHYNYQLRRSQLRGEPPPFNPFEAGDLLTAQRKARRDRLLRPYTVVRDWLVGALPEADETGEVPLAPPLTGATQALFRRVMGAAPFVPVWHPAWLDLRPLRGRLDAHLQELTSTLLYIGDDDAEFEAVPRMSRVGAHRALDGDIPGTGYALVVIALRRRDVKQGRALIERVRPLIAASGGHIVLYLRDPIPVGKTDLCADVLRHMDTTLPHDLHRIEVAFAGGRAKRWLQAAFEGLVTTLGQPDRTLARWWAGLRLALLLPCLAAFNLSRCRLQDERQTVSPCSSLVVTLAV